MVPVHRPSRCCCFSFGRRVTVQAKMQPLGNVISDSGYVRYHLLFQDDTILQENLDAVRQHMVAGTIKDHRADDLAFYCNAYNLWSMFLAYQKLEKTDKKWKGNVNLVERARFFVLTSITVAGKRTNLKSLENDVIRKFGDPRIHFAINCASYSCPPLPNFMFDAENLDEQLDTQTRRFINEAGGVKINKSEKIVELSQIFKWYQADFKASEYGSTIAFINHYLEGEQITDEMKVTYMPYDWSVNWLKGL